MAKHRAPAIFAKVRACRAKVGAKPFKKMSPKQYKSFKACLKR